MRAREWGIAAGFGDPGDYGIPELPKWRVRRLDCGGIAFVADGDRFIAAERPMKIRR